MQALILGEQKIPQPECARRIVELQLLQPKIPVPVHVPAKRTAITWLAQTVPH
jgi:hypothetical protein